MSVRWWDTVAIIPLMVPNYSSYKDWDRTPNQESQFGVLPEWTPNWYYWFGVLSQSLPSSGWRKQSFWEGKRQKIELKLFLLGHDQYKRYILQKTGSKTAICVLRTGLSNLHPLMWGSHGQLDDWPTKTQMTIGDHLVGWATNCLLVGHTGVHWDAGRDYVPSFFELLCFASIAFGCSLSVCSMFNA